MSKFPFSLLAVLVIAFFIAGCAGTPPDQVSTETAADPPAEMTETMPEEISTESNRVWMPVEEVVAYSDGTVDKVTTMKYNEAGRLQEVIETDGQGDLIRNRKWTYDSDILVSVELSDAEGLVAVTLIETGDDGRVIQEIRQNPTGKVIGSLAYEYVDGDHVAGTVSYDGIGAPLLETTYIYRQDLLTRVEFSIPGGSSDGYIEKIYDGTQLAREETYRADGSLEKAVDYEYDRGLAIKEVYYVGNRQDMVLSRKFDVNGNAVEEKWSNGAGTVFEVITRTFVEFDAESGI